MRNNSTPIYLLTFVLLSMLLGGCAVKPIPTGPPCEVAPQVEDHWYNTGHIYQMRHEGVLQFGDMTIPMTGLMKLNTKNGSARIAILTSMGIKLLVLDLTKEGHDFLYTSPAADKIPGFKKGAVRAIRSVFLTPFPNKPDACFEVDMVQHSVEENPDGQVQFRMNRKTGDLLAKETDDWSVGYNNYAPIDKVRQPDEIQYQDRSGRFSVTLKLISAKQK